MCKLTSKRCTVPCRVGRFSRSASVTQSCSRPSSSARWQRAFNAGARPQRLLFASTGTKDPKASDVLYVRGLIAPLTVNTMPEGTLHAFAEHGELGPELSPNGGDSAEVLLEFGRSGIKYEALAMRLQEEGATAFVASWKDLLGVIASKTTTAAKV
jgi:transaldolase